MAMDVKLSKKVPGVLNKPGSRFVENFAERFCSCDEPETLAYSSQNHENVSCRTHRPLGQPVFPCLRRQRRSRKLLPQHLPCRLLPTGKARASLPHSGLPPSGLPQSSRQLSPGIPSGLPRAVLPSRAGLLPSSAGLLPLVFPLPLIETVR